jgi:Sulfotransferase family
MPLAPYLDLQGRLYRAACKASGAAVIVDSSKHPAYAYTLGLFDFVELYIVHLVRDPRGCAYSWALRKEHPDPAIDRLPSPGPVKSALHWNFANTATRLVFHSLNRRYLIVRYEDFVARPRDVVVRILDFVGERVSELPFLSQHSVLLKPLHGVSGNPARVRTGTVELKLDEKWRTAMDKKHKLVVTLLTAPMLNTYGYSFF